jgi:hypothetical protein
MTFYLLVIPAFLAIHLCATAHGTPMFFGAQRLRTLVVQIGRLLVRSFEPQSGNEKSFRRQQYIRSAASKNKASKEYLSLKLKHLGSEAFHAAHPDLKDFEPVEKAFKPHAGLQFQNATDQLRAFANLQGLKVPSKVFSKIEGITLLLASLAECQSQTQALSIFLLYMKTHFDESLIQVGAHAFESLFETPDEFEPHAGSDRPDWLTSLRSCSTNWALITKNPVFKKISFLISICVTLGLCDAASFRWDYQGVRLFSIPACERHHSAIDLADAAIETVMYFVEGGYECFMTNSITPFMYSDLRARDFELEYSFLTSNLEHIKTGNLRKCTGVEVHDYDLRLCTCIQDADDMYRSASGTWEKKILWDRLTMLKKVKVTCDSIRVEGGLRVAPFTVNIFGDTGVGKSSVSAIVMSVLLQSNGYDASDKMVVSLNDNDKYMSNLKSYTNGIFLDDVGNTKPDFVERAPTKTIIELCNNVRQSANMAEADMKGKVSIEPKVVIITTNVKNLCAEVFSNEPASIVRRAHITTTVKVKEKFCSKNYKGAVGQQLDSAAVREFYTDETGLCDIPIIPDLWDITLERVVPYKQAGATSASSISWEILRFEDEEMKDVDIFTFLRCACVMSKDHYIGQDLLVERSNNLSDKIEMCACGMPKVVCSCLEPHVGYLFGAVLGSVVSSQVERITNVVTSTFEKEGNIIEKMATKTLLRCVSDFESSSFRWTNLLPADWLRHKYGKQFILYALRDEFALTARREAYTSFVCCVILLMYGLFMPIYLPFCLLTIAYLLYRVAVIVGTVKERLYEEILQRNDALPEVFKNVRDAKAKYILMALGSVGVLYTMLSVWKGFRAAATSAHGTLTPSSLEDINKRDSEVNVWASAEATPLNVSSIHKTTTVEQLSDIVYKNLVFIRVAQSTCNRVCDGVFLCSNVMLMPYHMFYNGGDMTKAIEPSIKVDFQRGPRGKVGCGFEAILSTTYMVRIPDTDLCVVWVPSGGDWKDITRWLPLDTIRAGPVHMVYKKSEGTRLDASAFIDPKKVGHCYSEFQGASYNLSVPTFSGLCMATFISAGIGPHIVGFHLGGTQGTPRGCLGTVSQKQVLTAIIELADSPGVILCNSQSATPTSQYGVDFYTGPEIHFKSPVNYLEETANIEVFGSVTGQVTPHSNVCPTIITDAIEEVCGVPQQWGAPPLFPRYKPWNDSLTFSSHPSVGFEGEHLAWAVEDYKRPLIHMIKTKEYIANEIRPLSRMETVCGIDGRRFVDKMPAKTSVGYPLTGPKSNFLTLLDPEDFPDHSFPVELHEQFWSEAERCEALYLEGERAYPIFKGAIKDEPTPITKEKARVFQCAPLHFQLLTRKYFLPVTRFLSLHPLDTECAVGINCQGPEWEQLQRHITSFGKDRVLAGDYSKYDLRMPAQVLFASFRILIDLAEASGNYTLRDLKIMNGIATDICYPLVAFNGTLIQLKGSHPSGNNITVYGNCVANSLQLRCAFAGIIRPKDVTFRQAAAMTTYGDDCKGSVSRKYPEYNHISVAKYFAEHDVVFTMPDKTSVPTAYMNDADCDFLKRRSIYNPDVQMHFGALEEDSIFKSLHCVIKSKVLSPTEQAIQNIDGALREWFAHGEEVYELRRAQMIEVSTRTGLMCRETDVPYAARLAAWKEKYLEEE